MCSNELQAMCSDDTKPVKSLGKMVKHWGPIRQWNNLPREVMEVLLWKKPCFCSASLSPKHKSSLVSTAGLLFCNLLSFLCHNKSSEELYYMVRSGLFFSMVQVCHFSSASLQNEFFSWTWKKKLHGYLLARLLKVFVLSFF